MEKINEYRLIRLLGQGTFAETYEAIGPNNKRVALKLIREQALQLGFDLKRFRHEVRGLQKAVGRNVVKLFDANTIQLGNTTRYYLVMEYLDGQNLHEAFEKANKSFDEPILRNILYQIITGMETIHKQNQIHRDLKPANIYLTNEGVIKLLDFGLVKMLDYTALTTMPGQAIGTPLYMAPEILNENGHVDFRADFYSFGVLMYHLLTNGEYPLHARTPLEYYRKLIENPPVPPTRHNKLLSSEIENLILTLLSKEPYERMYNHEELKNAMTDLPFAIPQFSDTDISLKSKHYPKKCYFHVLHNEKGVIEKYITIPEPDGTQSQMSGIVYGANFLPRYQPSLEFYKDKEILYFFDPVSYRFQYSVFSQSVGLSQLPYAPKQKSILAPNQLQTLSSQQKYVKECIDWQLHWDCDILVAPFHFSRDLNSAWIDIDIKLIEESIAYAKDKASGRYVFAGLCLNIEALTEPSNRSLLLNRYSRARADGYLFYMDGIYERNSVPLQLSSFLELLKQFQKLGKPVIAGKVGTLGIGLLAAGVDGITNGVSTMTSFAEANLKRPPGNGSTSPSYYIPHLMVTLPVKMTEDILSQAKNAQYRCNCPHCKGMSNNLKQSAKQHFIYIRNQEVRQLNLLSSDANRIQWYRKRVENALAACRKVSKDKGLGFGHSNYRHLTTWLNVFT